MNSKQNPCQALMVPGVVGTVPENFDSVLVYDYAGLSLSLFVGHLTPDKYACGYSLHFPDGRNFKKLPGHGSGYFTQKNHALLYAAHAVRIAFSSEFNEGAKYELVKKIQEFSSPSLF